MCPVSPPLRLRPVALILAVLLIAGGGLALAATRGTGAVSVPPTTPKRLVAAMIREADRRPSVSGTLLAHVAVGLPTLPENTGPAGQAGVADLLGYISGDHEVRVWSSADGLRVAELIRPASELSYFANARGAWAWNSDRFTAYRVPLGRLNPFRRGGSGASDPPAPAFLTPDTIARLSIEILSRSSAVQLGAPVHVAGRAAYALDMIPRTSATLVGRIELDVDAKTHIPLAVGVFARGASRPALSLGYERVSFSPIDSGTFAFTPPAGAKVVRVGRGHGMGSTPHPGIAPGLAAGVRTFGTGWGTVTAIPTPSLPTLRTLAGGLDPSLLLPISGPLFSATLVQRGDHGWLLFGAVPSSRLAAVAATLH
jgi:outer membrane lipoprotein-sorting protein